MGSMSNSIAWSCVLAALLPGISVAAEPSGAPDAGEAIDLPQAGMSATIVGEQSRVAVPQSVDVVTRADLLRTEGLFLDDALNLVPGVRFESRTLSGGQRITIRG